MGFLSKMKDNVSAAANKVAEKAGEVAAKAKDMKDAAVSKISTGLSAIGVAGGGGKEKAMKEEAELSAHAASRRVQALENDLKAERTKLASMQRTAAAAQKKNDEQSDKILELEQQSVQSQAAMGKLEGTNEDLASQLARLNGDLQGSAAEQAAAREAKLQEALEAGTKFDDMEKRALRAEEALSSTEALAIDSQIAADTAQTKLTEFKRIYDRTMEKTTQRDRLDAVAQGQSLCTKRAAEINRLEQELRCSQANPNITGPGMGQARRALTQLAQRIKYLATLQKTELQLLDSRKRKQQQQEDLTTTATDGNTAMVTDLLRAGASVNTPDELGCTPLQYACGNGHLDTAKLLLAEGADLQEPTGGSTALITAVQHNHQDVALLLIQSGADIDALDKDTRTAVHRACEEKRPDMLTLLLQHGADINLADKHGNTPLHLACMTGDEQIARRLLEAGARHDITNRNRKSAGQLAIDCGFIKVIFVFRELVDPNLGYVDGGREFQNSSQKPQVSATEAQAQSSAELVEDSSVDKGSTTFMSPFKRTKIAPAAASGSGREELMRTGNAIMSPQAISNI
jgi:26S proteasome non-ATPase regulatory subunit 10